MRIGIVSDSHGRAERLKAAVEALRSAGAEAIVHCGDIGSLECLSCLTAGGLPCYAVAGNMDRRLAGLGEAAGLRGVRFDAKAITVPLGDERQLAVTHGHDWALVRKLVESGEYAYVCCGHSHTPSDTREGACRVINPGALYNCRTYTAAVLDTATDELQLLTIEAKT